MGDLASCWDEIDKMLVIQLGEIQGSFGRRITVMEHKYKRHKLLPELEGYVSKAALAFIDDELARSRTFTVDKEDCGCVQKTNYGLSCACIISDKRKKKLHILLDEVHSYWKRLSVHGEEVGALFPLQRNGTSFKNVSEEPLTR